MNVLIFGSTGMVGQGVLRECVLDPGINLIQTVGHTHTPTGMHNPKVREVVHPNLWDYAAIEDRLSNFDACFFALVCPRLG